MSAALVVEAAREEDIDALVAVETSAFSPPHLSAGGTQLREELARPWARLWLARLGPGAPASAFIVAWHVADELHVLNVATHPEARRRGLARALMEAVLAFARAHATRLLLLEVRRSNVAAIALYRAHGFVAIRRRRAYYADGEDALEMVLELDGRTGAVVPREDEVSREPTD